MYTNKIPSLKIGNIEINPPIIQGGMGVRVSGANLAAAVANTGCAGVIAGAGLGLFEQNRGSEFSALNEKALRAETQKARKMTNGILGLNIMVAMTDYDNLVRAAVDEGIDMIISGAGLPMNLPALAGGKDIKLIPIVSSARTFQIICKRWHLHFNRLPDAVIVEGPHAGGHLGYSFEEASTDSAMPLEDIVIEVLKAAKNYDKAIPVIAAGGIFDGGDIAKFLALGASGVQMATRFVCTDECDAHINFKNMYINAGKEDITIIKSPVGLPGRVIRNDFVDKINAGTTRPFKCRYHCLKTCNPAKAPYCIAEVLADASLGKLGQSFAFAGSNAPRCTEIVPVARLVNTLKAEFLDAVAALR